MFYCLIIKIIVITTKATTTVIFRAPYLSDKREHTAL